MNIHQRIKKAREAKGWTMQELAEKVGYAGFTAISKVENGERSINHEMLKKYADVLEVSPLWLLYGDGDELTFHAENLYNNLLKRQESEKAFNADLDLDADFSFTATKEQDNGLDIIEGYRLFIKKKDKIEKGELVLVSIGQSTHLVYWYYLEKSDTLVLLPCGNSAYGSTVFPPSRRKLLNYIGTVVYVARKPHRREDVINT